MPDDVAGKSLINDRRPESQYCSGVSGYGDSDRRWDGISMAAIHQASALTGVGFFADQAPHLTLKPPTDPLTRHVAEAGSAAVDNARRRLASRLPTRALAAADQYFAAPDVDTWDGEVRPEPGADVLLLSPARRAAVATSNVAIELRQFDRQCPRWAPFADDIATVTGADVVLRLLVADGESKAPQGRRAGDPKAGGGRPSGDSRIGREHKADDWRRAGSDVLITVIDGAERFAVASTEPPDAEPEPELDTVLRPGDALRLPRTMLHAAHPDAGGSALLSMKLRRATDWSLRRATPSHLGFRDYPSSARVYRLCLRSHVPPTPIATSASWDPDTALLRTRIPGGLAVLGVHAKEVTFVAAGSVYRASNQVVRALAAVHAADGIGTSDLAERIEVSVRVVQPVVDSLLTSGLVRLDQPSLS